MFIATLDEPGYDYQTGFNATAYVADTISGVKRLIADEDSEMFLDPDVEDQFRYKVYDTETGDTFSIVSRKVVKAEITVQRN